MKTHKTIRIFFPLMLLVLAGSFSAHASKSGGWDFENSTLPESFSLPLVAEAIRTYSHSERDGGCEVEALSQFLASQTESAVELIKIQLSSLALSEDEQSCLDAALKPAQQPKQ